VSTTKPGSVGVDEALPAAAPAEEEERFSLGALVKRLGQGELGSLRVLIVLAIVWIIFAIANSNFLTATNLTNLALQIAAVGTISIGVVFVLLLGEIDLSVGAVSGLTSAIMAVLSVKHGWNPYLAMLAALLAGAAIGLLQGSLVTWLTIPSFVVTLAGLLTWQGAQLKVLGETGTVNITDPAITNLANKFLADWLGWLFAIVAIAALLLAQLNERRRRMAAALETEPLSSLVVRVGAAAIAIVAAVYVVDQDRGVPVSLVILVGLCAFFDYIVRRTRYGRHILAVGGNEEAARRVGIKTGRIKTTVFVLASTLAAAGGILAASRLLAVNQSSGGSDLLLLAIAGPVIAGVSLFGGRGSVWGALLGALVIGSISNGMDLLGLESSVKYMVTGGVLAFAVIIDALGRKQRAVRGRA
jgi:D-xylose transport system permease protein